MAVAKPTHINLEVLAVRVINAGEAAALLPAVDHEVMTRGELVRRVVEALRKQRLDWPDHEFRRVYCKHF